MSLSENHILFYGVLATAKAEGKAEAKPAAAKQESKPEAKAEVKPEPKAEAPADDDFDVFAEGNEDDDAEHEAELMRRAKETEGKLLICAYALVNILVYFPVAKTRYNLDLFDS
jgi:hypothetical protein